MRPISKRGTRRGLAMGTALSLTGLLLAGLTGLGSAQADTATAAADTATAAAPTAVDGVPTSVTTLTTGLTVPWGVDWLPDGAGALVTERDDFRVWKVGPDGAKTQVGTVPNSQTTNGEGGLMGVAVDPDWATNHHVYFMHTAAEGNRIARMTYDGTSLSGYTVILQGIAKARFHNGGRLAFGPDGFLYATTGDAQNTALAQDRNSLNGKILRLTTSGDPAPGNPFGNHVYSLGHRNPQGLAFDRNGRLWSAEFGNTRFDELNLIKPGANYGWPTCEGTCSVAGMTNPKKTWTTGEASPSAITIADNVVYMAAQRGERLWRIPIEGDTENVGTATAYYVGTYGRLRTVVKVPGSEQLWLTTTNADASGGEADGADRVLRLTLG
ncbi:PQQ-dependent sugar dehydrogenase [Streptomyces sp. CA-288835]|uniref:PQQ-dependent sugar dehydrogenase n=1 Tax=Streptomyces sp. CA-288835 TaxID=3240069 RepID=UPI003D8F1E62